MDHHLFESEIDKWCADVKGECLRLHNDNVPSERCLEIAIATADAKATRRAMDRATLARPAMMVLPQAQH